MLYYWTKSSYFILILCIIMCVYMVCVCVLMCTRIILVCVCGSRIGICVQKQMFSQGVCGALSSVWKRMHAVLTVIGACVKANPCWGPLCGLLSCIPTFLPVDWNPGRCTADIETCLLWLKGKQGDRLHSKTLILPKHTLVFGSPYITSVHVYIDRIGVWLLIPWVKS